MCAYVYVGQGATSVERSIHLRCFSASSHCAACSLSSQPPISLSLPPSPSVLIPRCPPHPVRLFNTAIPLFSKQSLLASSMLAFAVCFRSCSVKFLPERHPPTCPSSRYPSSSSIPPFPISTSASCFPVPRIFPCCSARNASRHGRRGNARPRSARGGG